MPPDDPPLAQPLPTEPLAEPTPEPSAEPLLELLPEPSATPLLPLLNDPPLDEGASSDIAASPVFPFPIPELEQPMVKLAASAGVAR
jgi:hypothetical protein